MKMNLSQKIQDNNSIRKQLSGTVRPITSASRTLQSIYNDSNPPPSAVDQFAPCLSRKLTLKRLNRPTSKQSIRTPNYDGDFGQTQPIPIPTTDYSSYFQEEKPKHRFSHQNLEKLFDDIASSACDQPLNKLVEDNFRTFFNVEKVSFFHDISSVSSLYCPTNSVVCPHGSGLIGYCHFSRQIINIKCANTHVSFSPVYDGRICQANSRLFIFPLFDYQSHVKSVVQMLRSASLPPFDEEDERAAEYLQKKFQKYSRWLFQPVTSEGTFSDLVKAQRLGEFVETMTVKLQRLFNCKTAEIWEYNNEDQEIRMFVPCASVPLPVPLSDSGVVGFALSHASAISLIASNTHAAYNKRTDGNGDQSILIIPVKDPRSTRVYGLVLRGKRLPHFFTDIDEKILAKIAPIVVASLNSSEFVESSFQRLEDSVRAQKRLQSLLEVAEALSGQLHIDELIPSIMNRACDLVKADRCSLFMVNETREKLVTSFHGGLTNAIEIPISAGIVGYTATTGQILNIKDAYEDPRFNRATDLSTGYRTHNLLCVPIFNDKNEIRGVTEMINKIDGVFTKEDEKLIQVFNVFVGISIENARLYSASIDLSLQLQSVLEISYTIAQSNTVKKLCEEILRNSRKVIGACRAMIFLSKDENNNEIEKLETFILDEDVDAKLSRAKKDNEEGRTGAKLGVRRALIHKMMVLSIGSGTDKDGKKIIERFQQEDIDRNNAVKTVIKSAESLLLNNEDNPCESMIITPIRGTDGSVMGAVLMQWKKRENLFTEDDLKMLESFTVFISISIERSNVKAQTTIGAAEAEVRQNFDENERKNSSLIDKFKPSQEEVKLFLSRSFNSTDFDDFKLIFSFFDLLQIRPSIPIPNETLYCFIYLLRNSYNPDFMHDWNHAKETAQFLVHVLVNGEISSSFSAKEKFELLIACLSHDAGYNQRESIEIPLSLLYGKKSEIESHHVASLIQIAAKQQCNIFVCFDDDNKKEFTEVWNNVIELILATDMSAHFDLIDQIQDVLMIDKSFTKPENRLLLMKLLVMMCDISVIARPFEFANKAKNIISEDFFNCGDFSRLTGIDGNSLKDIKNLDNEKRLFSFIISVCIPIFENVIAIFPNLKYLIEQIRGNMEKWNMKIE